MLTLPNNQIVKTLHIEPTDACNAACPQCAREVGINFDKLAPANHLTVAQLTKVIGTDFIKNLDKVFVCGDYGDPAAGKHTVEILKYFRKINPNITLGMNTNGSLRTTVWWASLATLFNKPSDYVVWSIDGLSDTNHIYRINTNWNKIINNVKAFIGAGGLAHWDMLVFKHNEHQLDQAEALARELGFKWFRAKVSRRFESVPVKFLSPPASYKPPQTRSSSINCHALSESSLYISSKGNIHPCCWFGIYPDKTLDKFNEIQSSWNSETPNQVCVETCSKTESGTQFINQWHRTIEF